MYVILNWLIEKGVFKWIVSTMAGIIVEVAIKEVVGEKIKICIKDKYARVIMWVVFAIVIFVLVLWFIVPTLTDHIGVRDFDLKHYTNGQPLVAIDEKATVAEQNGQEIKGYYQNIGNRFIYIAGKRNDSQIWTVLSVADKNSATSEWASRVQIDRIEGERANGDVFYLRAFVTHEDIAVHDPAFLKKLTPQEIESFDSYSNSIEIRANNIMPRGIRGG
ncbi:MAG: hypothetical protein HY754_00235 [Nitrospirae bacterium]|nr:hypothetical protein [Nitrospirota bacterium]